MSLRDYRDQFGSQQEIKQYNCRVPGCTRYVSWTYSGINDHLKSHSLTMTEYEEIYINKTRTSGSVDSQVDSKLDELVAQWSLGEWRACRLCHAQVIGEMAVFASHLTACHQLSLGQYTTQQGPGSCDRQLEHSCRVCEESVQLLPDSLAQHLLGHSITLKEYYRKYIVKSKTSLQTKSTANGVLASSEGLKASLPAGGIAKGGESSASSGGLPVKPPSELSKTTTGGKLGGTKAVDPTKPLVFKVRKNHWANGCKYSCALCPEIQFPEEFVFKKHIQLTHGMTADQYQNNFGSPAVTLQLHVCKVCGKSMKHEYTAILNHLRTKHTMTLTMYTQTYIKPNASNQVPTSTSGPTAVVNQQPQQSQIKPQKPQISPTKPQSKLSSNPDEDTEFYTVYT